MVQTEVKVEVGTTVESQIEAVTQRDVLQNMVQKFIAAKTEKSIKGMQKAVEKIKTEWTEEMEVKINRGKDVEPEIVKLDQEKKEVFNLLGNREELVDMFAEEDKTFIKGKVLAHIRRTAQQFYKE